MLKEMDNIVVDLPWRRLRVEQEFEVLRMARGFIGVMGSS